MKEIKPLLDEFRSKKKNVSGGSSEIQMREQDGRLLEDTEVVRVYVDEKVSEDKLSAKDLVPETVVVNGREYEVDVYELGKLVALDEPVPLDENPNPKLRYRPLFMGISTMNYRSTGACSLGGFFADHFNGKPVQITNQHCFGMENDAQAGDLVGQPSIMDGGKKATDVTGTFLRGVDLKFSEFKCNWRNSAHWFYRRMAGLKVNKVDVSCAYIKNGIGYKREAPNGRQITGTAEVGTISDKPWAYGRSSSYSYKGEYIDFSGYVQVGYRRGKCIFDDVVIGKSNSTFKCIPGDSGSFWAEDDKFIGLRFAGSNISWIGCKWSNIARELYVRELP